MIQAGRLQCLNGAYLSEVDADLALIILGQDYTLEGEHNSLSALTASITTGESIRLLKGRVGQKTFADSVRANYNHCCCFPGCQVNDDRFLVGAHVARWADVPSLRGKLCNGICLCLMHDKAFELGLFVLTEDLTVRLNSPKISIANGSWGKKHISPYEGQKIKPGGKAISIEALRHHWERVGYTT